MATPSHAQIATTTGAFTPEQQTIINQIIALINELQRQLQIQLAIEAQEKSDAVDLKAQCDELSERRDAIWPQIDELGKKYSADVKQYNLSGNPFDYQYLPNLRKVYETELTRLQTEETRLINEHKELCN